MSSWDEVVEKLIFLLKILIFDPPMSAATDLVSPKFIPRSNTEV